jgi:kumamolisin
MLRWFRAMKLGAVLGASVVMPMAASAQSNGLTGQVIPPSQSDTRRVPLQGTESNPIAEAMPAGPVPSREQVQVTVFLKPATPLSPGEAAGVQRLTSAQYATKFGADPESLAKVSAFAEANGLRVVESDRVKRRVILAGTASAVAKAFGTQLHSFTLSTGQTFHTTVAPATVPANLAPDIDAVLGLDTRPVFSPHFMVSHAATGQGRFFYPQQIASLYDFPPDATGAGQTIAILELGGGFVQKDLDEYFRSLRLRSPKVTAISVGNVSNSPTSDADWAKESEDQKAKNPDNEVALDIDVAGVVANGADIAVYFTDATAQGFMNGLLDTIHAQPSPSAISISWGGPEDTLSVQFLNAMSSALFDAERLGITVVAASGDKGSWDGAVDGKGAPDKKLHVDFPASSPYVLACGGTTLMSTGNKIASETVWHNPTQAATGGGVSVEWARPAWQASAGIPSNPSGGIGRGVPDVAGDADAETGYVISLHGKYSLTGGTSAVAPLWAGLIAIFDQKLGSRLGFVNDKLYAMGSQGFHSIVLGNNDVAGLGAYSAHPGWNACTGLGSPDASKILSGLFSATLTNTAPLIFSR